MKEGRVEPYILRDMMRKCADDVTRAVRTSAFLLDHPDDRIAIAIAGSSKVMGMAAGVFMAAHKNACSPEEVVDAILGLLRPAATKAAEDILAKRQAREATR